MPGCLMLDDTLDVLPWAKQTLRLEAVESRDLESEPSYRELKELKETLAGKLTPLPSPSLPLSPSFSLSFSSPLVSFN